LAAFRAERQTTSIMKILSFGAGALGTYVAGSLALHGHSVVFLERPQVAEELRQRGLRLTIGGQEYNISEVRVASNLTETLALGPFDVAIFALKSFDTTGALVSLIPFSEELPPILCLQNGVENEIALVDALGAEKVIPGTMTSAISKRTAGDVVLERLRGLGVAAGHPLSSHLAMALDAAGLNARLYENSSAMKWSKLITNLIGNATSAILDMTPAEVYAHPHLYRLELAQLRECLAVMEAQHIPTVDLPGTSVRLLAFAIQKLPATISRPLLSRAIGKGRGSKMPSFHIDLHTGRRQSEVDYLNGAIVRAGLRLGLPTPVNQILTDTLISLTSGALQIQDFARHPERLLAQMPEIDNVK
jgi:2-dehydropantoate 2-reductase